MLHVTGTNANVIIPQNGIFQMCQFFVVPLGKVLLLNSLSVHMLIFYMYMLRA